MSLHRELRAGGTLFDRTRSLSRGLCGERCWCAEEVLERVQLGLWRGVDPAANLKREEPIRREAPTCGRDQATHEPEPVTLGEDGAHRLGGEVRMALRSPSGR